MVGYKQDGKQGVLKMIKKDLRAVTKILTMPLVKSLVATTLLWVFLCSQAPGAFLFAKGDWTDDQIADAIYLAEGGAKTRHPYGILVKYKVTTPRQACINTIRHARRDWDGKGDFIEFLGSRYAPIGADNDPRGLNRNWVKNVKYFLERSSQ